MTSARRPATLEVIVKVEDIFENIANSLLHEDELTVPLRCKKVQSTTSDELEAELSSNLMNVSFPAKTPQEAWRFSTQAATSRGLAIADLITSCTASYSRTHT